MSSAVREKHSRRNFVKKATIAGSEFENLTTFRFLEPSAQ
jgi:hypothetical protein